MKVKWMEHKMDEKVWKMVKEKRNKQKRERP